jgi:hypothetical protein
MLYYPNENLLRVYPGSKIPSTYEPKKQPWYINLMNADSDLVGTVDYPDEIAQGSERIISLGIKLIDGGFFICDVPVTKIYAILDQIEYLDGKAVLVTNENIYISKTGTDSGYWSDIDGLVENLIAS